MLRIFTVLLLLMGVGLAAKGAAVGQEFVSEGIKYQITAENPRRVQVTGAEPGVYELVIPEKVSYDNQPYSVTEIKELAFANRGDIFSVTLNEGLERIGAHCFENMGSLESVVINSSVIRQIPEYAFNECTALSQVILPDQIVSIGDWAFCRTISLHSIDLPQQLESIGDYAFAAHTGGEMDPRSGEGLQYLICPPALKRIGTAAFRFVDMASVDLNEGLEEIGLFAFWRCAHLCRFKLPSTIKTVGSGAFQKDYTGAYMPNFTLPASLTTIGPWAFDMLIGEMFIETPITITDEMVGKSAIINFKRESGNIDGSAFWLGKTDSELTYGNALRMIFLESAVPPVIEGNLDLTAYECSAITVIIPDGCLDAYQRNPLWNKFTLIEESAVEARVEMTGGYPLSEEIRMQAGKMPSKVGKLIVSGELSADDFNLIRTAMPSLYSLDMSGVTNTEIPKEALSDMSSLKEIILPENTKRINERAFRSNYMMDTPALPETVEFIGREAFSGCASLSITKLPDALKELEGSYEFFRCFSLSNLTAGPNFVSMASPEMRESYWFGRSFEDCWGLESIDFSQSQIDMVSEYYFKDCVSLKEVKLPSTVQDIKREAFYNTRVQDMEWPMNLKVIGNDVFTGAGFTTINLPEGLERIGDCFEENHNLLTVTLPSTMTEIRFEAFNADERLSVISCAATTPPPAEMIHIGVATAWCSLIIPTSSVRAYSNAVGWGAFTETLDRVDIELSSNLKATVIGEGEWQVGVPDNLKSGAQFANVFNGSTAMIGDKAGGLRLFFHPETGYAVKSILLNGVEIIDQLEGNSLLLEQPISGTLKVLTEVSSVVEIPAEEGECEYYTIDGRKIQGNPTPGLYIMRKGNRSEKVVITSSSQL